MPITHYKDLIVWQKSVDLVSEIYKLANQFPPHEQYGLSSQMRRAAVSIPANIAEGYGRNNRGEFVHFLAIARASSYELDTELVIAKREYANLDYAAAESLLTEVQKMLWSMIQKLKSKTNTQRSALDARPSFQ